MKKDPMDKPYSDRFEIVRTDLKAWGRAILIYIAPTLIIILQKYQGEGILTKDFLVGVVISAVIDILRRFLRDDPTKNAG